MLALSTIPDTAQAPFRDDDLEVIERILYSAICYGLIARHVTTNKCKALPRRIPNLGLCEVPWRSTPRWTGRA